MFNLPQAVPAFTAFMGGRKKRYSASAIRWGSHTANHFPSITRAEAKEMATVSRQQGRASAFRLSFMELKQTAGGDGRRRVRAMARALSKRRIIAVREEKAREVLRSTEQIVA